MRIAQLYLEEEESVQAEMFIKRASQFMGDVKDGTLVLRFKVRCFLFVCLFVVVVVFLFFAW